MAGRCTSPWPIFCLLAALTATAGVHAAPVVDILRLQPQTDGVTNATLAADEVYSWTDGNEQVYVLAGSVLIRQDLTEIWCERAVVWVDTEGRRQFKPTRVVVYADEAKGKSVRIESRGSARQVVSAAVVEFQTPALGSIRGGERKQSLAESNFYRSALAARGKPVPPLPVPKDEPKAPAEIQPAQFTNPQVPSETDSPPVVEGTTVVPIQLQDARTIWISPRTNRPYNLHPVVTGKEKALIVTGGIKLLAKFAKGSVRSLEVEADQAVIWRQDGDSTPVVDAMRSEEGAQGADRIELYLTGDVVLRYSTVQDSDPTGVQLQTRTLRADRVYYDVGNHKAIALAADMEYSREGYYNTGHVVAPEIQQLSSTEFTAYEAIVHASRLPSDPGVEFYMRRAEVYREPKGARRTIFGTAFRDRRTGNVVEESPEILEATDLSVWSRSIPFFYLPRTRTNLKDPFGPFQGISFRQDNIFGFQAYGTWDMLDLVGLTKLDGERWLLMTDYMTLRGPALGSTYSRTGRNMFGLEAPYQSNVKLYGIYDQGNDVLGGPRDKAFDPPAFRGRALWTHQQRFSLFESEDITVQAQISYLSDRNFLEQYYEMEYNFGFNQETFLWTKYQTGNFASTLLVEPDIGRNWVSETHWLPRGDVYLIGQSLFDRFTYHSWASAAYAQMNIFRPPLNEYPDIPSYLFPPIEENASTGRFDWMQKISLPLDIGPVKFVPYGVLDLAYYTQGVDDVDGRGRIYGGGGARASMPLSRLYRDVESDLFNLQGLYHKNLFSVNYYIAASSAPWTAFAQLDRLNDDAMEAGWRDVTPWQPTFPQLPRDNGLALALGSYERFNPRLYAIRRLVDTKPDTLDDIQVLQMDWRQRLQTKRGYPGMEHTVDWFTLDLSASLFPVEDRDNFGSTFGFLEYAATWNVGDRTTLFSNGWFDPFDFGARYWEVGTQFFRDDRTQFTLTYKSIDPIQSRLVSGSATYVFSPKYAVTAITAYDFGYQESLTNSVMFTRVGTDTQISVGFTYNSIVQNFGLTLNIVPNLIANQASPVAQRGFGGPGGAGMGGAGGAGLGGGR